jgi:hypothetical protein
MMSCGWIKPTIMLRFGAPIVGRPWAVFRTLRDDSLLPVICPTCQVVSEKAQVAATLHEVVFRNFAVNRPAIKWNLISSGFKPAGRTTVRASPQA